MNDLQLPHMGQYCDFLKFEINIAEPLIVYGYDNNGNLLTQTETAFINGEAQTPVVVQTKRGHGTWGGTWGRFMRLVNDM